MPDETPDVPEPEDTASEPDGAASEPEASEPDGTASEPEEGAAAEAQDTASEPEGAASEPEEASPPPIAPEHEALLNRLRGELGDSILDAVSNHGHLVVRVANDAWRRAAEVARDRLDCDYLSFISAIDWMPRPVPDTEDEGSLSMPSQPEEMSFGVAGSAGRLQVFACIESTEAHHELILKTDVDEQDPTVASWVEVYPGADWHERECWEMFGVRFDGHPHLRHLYLPGEFEGYPLRKDFPLLARQVKPWPGIVDVELMPEDDTEGDSADAEPADVSAGEGEA